MARKGFFEIEPAPGKPEGISVRIEPGADGDVWMTVNDIVKAYGVFYQTVRAGLKALKKSGDFDEYRDVKIERFTYKGKTCSIELYNLRIVIAWKSHATLTLLAKQDLPTFGYNMIDPLKSWCWGSILFYPFKISRFS